MKHSYEKILSFFSGITKEERNNLYLAAMLLIVFCVFLLLVFIPQQRRFASKIKELRKTEKQTAEVMSFSQGKDFTQAVKALNINLVEITNKFADTEEMVIYKLSDSAKKLKLNVMNITPGDTVLVAHKASGFDIKEMPLTMNLVGEFRALGEYINKLENSSPVLVEIKRVEVKNKGEFQIPLDINLQLSAFIAIERK